MTKNKIFATIAVALIAGVSIFVACTKEENKLNIKEDNISPKLEDQPWGRHRCWSDQYMDCIAQQPFNCFDDVVVTPTSSNYYNSFKTAIQNQLSDDIVGVFLDGTYTYFMPVLDDYIINYLVDENTSYNIIVNEATEKEYIIAKNEYFFTDEDSIHFTKFIFPFSLNNNNSDE